MDLILFCDVGRTFLSHARGHCDRAGMPHDSHGCTSPKFPMVHYLLATSTSTLPIETSPSFPSHPIPSRSLQPPPPPNPLNDTKPPPALNPQRCHPRGIPEVECAVLPRPSQADARSGGKSKIGRRWEWDKGARRVQGKFLVSLSSRFRFFLVSGHGDGLTSVACVPSDSMSKVTNLLQSIPFLFWRLP